MVDLKNLSDQLSELTIVEAAELVQTLEKKWGVSGQAIQSQTASPSEEKKVEEKTEFDVVLKSAGPKKIQVIKAIREITELSLKDAKLLVDGAPKTIRAGIPKAEAKDIQTKLEKQGAIISVE
jgi:large subunit ribosomal protein L7/L12